MNWKSWPYWLKGAAIGLLVAIIFILILNSFPLAPIVWPLHLYLVKKIIAPYESYLPIFLIDYVIKPLFYIIYGIIIGWILGKIKSYKKIDY